MKVVICAAGVGSRLGMDIPKSMVVVEGTTLIKRQLDIICGIFEDVNIVVGFKSELIEKEVEKYPVNIINNKDYASTTVVDSAILGIGDYLGSVLVVDGDIIFTEKDIITIYEIDSPVVGIKTIISRDNPVFVSIQGDSICEFYRGTRGKEAYEWAGICCVPSDYFTKCTKQTYLYKILEQQLPLKFLCVNSVEIDTVEDLEEAKLWMKTLK